MDLSGIKTDLNIANIKQSGGSVRGDVLLTISDGGVELFKGTFPVDFEAESNIEFISQAKRYVAEILTIGADALAEPRD
jgi:hypothetical protein